MSTLRRLKFETLDEAAQEASRLLEFGYVRSGNWSLGQICRHLTLVQNPSIDGYPFWLSLFAPLRPAMRWWLLPKLLDMQPVVMVSWYAADAYSRWANGHDWAADGSERSYLPTEAQWEYAAQGTFDKKESIYAGIHQRGETHELEGLPLPAVQQAYGSSRFGLRHMSGTIWHWCRDWFSPDFYRLDASTGLDPLADVDSGVRSERGGSWVGPIELCRPSYRRGRNPDARGRCLGFRCVGDS